MSEEKTISGHYDSAFSLDHNNRKFTPKNVDPSRSHWNYYCVAAGESAYLEFEDPRVVQEFWERYKELNSLYWSNRALADALEYERYCEHMRFLRKCMRMIGANPTNEVEEFFYMLLFPLIFIGELILTFKEAQTRADHLQFKRERKYQIQNYKRTKLTAREYLCACDRNAGTDYLNTMDSYVKKAAYAAQNYALASDKISFKPYKMERFATVEEIYNKVYEPSFRTFQNKQRPCRRYEGTYLEYIREGQHEMRVKKSQNKNTKNRKPSEAIELVFGIGDMDNTGYFAAFDDAKKSEAILKDYCNHLMMQKNICFVTTKELDNPKWQPPFKHGLIVANLTVHCDEATPGIHMTVIPYSRGCKRGPEAQASMGRAMTGMGYPSTWKDVLDENGERIPKRNRVGKVIMNEDGTVRYQQEPDKQGIIDWIEDQKNWIEKEMMRRYGWKREYKGSHPRGNLSTPDYKAARSLERQQEAECKINEMLNSFVAHINTQIDRLNESVDTVWHHSDDWEKVIRYLNTCPQEEYEELVDRAEKHLDYLPLKEQGIIKMKLQEQILEAAKKKKEQLSPVEKRENENNR